MHKKNVVMFLLGIVLALPVSVMVGCGGDEEVVKPETFAPPPDEADEKSDDGNG